MNKKPWTRIELLGLAAVLVGAISSAGTCFSPEIRAWLGFDVHRKSPPITQVETKGDQQPMAPVSTPPTTDRSVSTVTSTPNARSTDRTSPGPNPPDSQKSQSVPAKDLTAPLRRTESTLSKASLGRIPETRYRSAMIKIKPGDFRMGSPVDEKGFDRDGIRDDDETQHRVRISRPFHLAETEVTEGQYEAVLGSNPARRKEGPDYPVEWVSWYDAIKYCNRLSEIEDLDQCYKVTRRGVVTWPKGLACNGYRLPTEGEWEYSARAGTQTIYVGADDIRILCTLDNVGYTTRISCADGHSLKAPVGSFPPNGFGIRDMGGNLSEWVWDWHSPYSELPVTDPVGPSAGQMRVRRGGCWSGVPDNRVADRYPWNPRHHSETLGFRIARSRED